jgi:hypothetical protein
MISKAVCNDATYSAVSSTSTGELHERVYAPFRATAEVERVRERGNGERGQGRQRQAERGGDFDDPAPF